jgi:hypothetical protein
MIACASLGGEKIEVGERNGCDSPFLGRGSEKSLASGTIGRWQTADTLTNGRRAGVRNVVQ